MRVELEEQVTAETRNLIDAGFIREEENAVSDGIASIVPVTHPIPGNSIDYPSFNKPILYCFLRAGIRRSSHYFRSNYWNIFKFPIS